MRGVVFVVAFGWDRARIEPFGWDEFGVSVGHVDGPAGFVDHAVVGFAQRRHVVDVGVASSRPGGDVVHLAPVRRAAAAGSGAATVAGGEGSALRFGGGALGAAEVEDLTVPAEHGGMIAVSQSSIRR
jgi:hypothetical protein